MKENQNGREVVLIKWDSTVDLRLHWMTLDLRNNTWAIFTARISRVLPISHESLPADLSTALVWVQACLKVLVTQCCIAVCLGFDNLGGESDSVLTPMDFSFGTFPLPLLFNLPLILKINISGSPESQFRISHCEAWWGSFKLPSVSIEWHSLNQSGFLCNLWP